MTANLGTIFTWIPRFAYNENGDVLYLKETSGIAGEYITPEIFIYKASGVNAQDIALCGIWVEQENALGNIGSKLNTEENEYGLIANTKAEYVKLSENFVNAINQLNETGIKNIENNKIILKVVDEKLEEPIMANLSAKGKTVTIEITKTDNGIKEIRYIDGTKLEDFDGTKATYKVEKGGLNKFIIIDNLGNQRLYEINVFSPEIYVTNNVDNYIEFNGEKWYPAGTRVEAKFSDNMSGISGYYKIINGTVPDEPVDWTRTTNQTVYLGSISETMTYKVKIENSLGEVIGEDEETIHIMPTNTRIESNYTNNIGAIYPVQVSWYTSTSSGYGTETYRCDTYIRDAARHMGLIKQGDVNKELYIKIVPVPEGGYTGSRRNEVPTSAYYSYTNGYMFVTKNGEEIKLPKINNVKVTEDGNNITVKVDATTTNPDAEIVKYYYALDNTDTITDLDTAIKNLDTEMTSNKYKESESSEFVFEDVKAHQNHTIRVFVQDNYGEIGVLSNVYEETVKTTNGLQTPTIKILQPNSDEEFEENDPEIVEYDGKMWYPAGTRIEVTYSENLTSAEMNTLGLYGYYEHISDTTGEVVSSSEGANSVYTHTLTKSEMHKFKLKNKIGEESEEVSIHLNIMPYELYNTYTSGIYEYINNIGAIYPVRVTGNTNDYHSDISTRSRNRYIYI